MIRTTPIGHVLDTPTWFMSSYSDQTRRLGWGVRAVGGWLVRGLGATWWLLGGRWGWSGGFGG
jgi:hypothetical protein